MGLWKDRIDAEIGKVSWDKHVVHERINQKEQGKKIYKIPFVLISIATIIFILILTNQTIPLTQSSEQEKMSFLENIILILKQFILVGYQWEHLVLWII